MRRHAAHILRLGCRPKGVKHGSVKQAVKLPASHQGVETQSIGQLKSDISGRW